MNDISQEVDAGATQSDSTPDSMSTQGARQIYERESHIVVDYSHLDDEYKDVCIPTYLLFAHSSIDSYSLPLFAVYSLCFLLSLPHRCERRFKGFFILFIKSRF